MKTVLRWFSAVKKSFFKIKLVDRCLIVFMFLLMAQSTFNLFANEMNSQETNNFDIVVRTTSAAIFGYFLSVNFIKRPSEKSENKAAGSSGAAPHTAEKTAPADKQGTAPAVNQIGFSGESADTPELIRPAASVISAADANETSHQQIIIATIIGVFALCVLIVARNHCDFTPAMLGTVSQMRDFVSGCVGFLLGSPEMKGS